MSGRGLVIACVVSPLIGGLILVSRLSAQPSDTAPPSGGKPNVQMRTTGGMQFWTDELLFHDWRIQRNAYLGHYRLLDGENVRHAWGEFEQCQAALQRLKQQKGLVPMHGKAILVLHGLGRTRKSMQGLCQYLRDQGDYTVLNVSYASTRNNLETHASSLARIIQHLDGVQEINFVAHSLGNLVIRHYLGDQMKQPDRGPDPRIRRIVMLAPPNNGAQLAVRFRRNPLFSIVWGKSGDQLADDWNQVRERLAIPQNEFGIVAGHRGGIQNNPLLDGADDLVVTVEETRLPGATDFIVLPALHTFIMDDKAVRECTLRFIQHGYFVAADQRQPIAHADSEPGNSAP